VCVREREGGLVPIESESKCERESGVR